MIRTFRGVVIPGTKRGAALGYPTANIPLQDDPASGIYAARVIVKDGEAPYMAAVYADQKRKLLEAYLLDFYDDLYGCKIEIHLMKKIREARRFADDAALAAAIADDISRVREYFAG